jgi:pimeloyl-ACP methyl ester carboxylesterase
MPEQLQENGNPVQIGRLIVRTPGLSGTVEVYEPLDGGTRSMMRAAESSTPALAAALQNARTTEQMTIEITGAQEVDTGSEIARRGPHDEAVMEVTLPSAGDSYGQFILATDESGLVSWHFPRNEENAVDTARGSATRTYLIPRRVAATPVSPEGRGVLGAIGKKILKVVVFPLLDPFIGEVGELFVAKWEAHNRPYGIRTVTPGNYAQPIGEVISGEGWDALSAGPALLFVHGTFSRAYNAFGGLDAETIQALYERYEARLFAFDHPTLSADPADNARWFLEQVPPTARLQLDIICHSRGGLVSRELAWHHDVHADGSALELKRIVFVASPNAGTILTDAPHMSDFIDTYTNLLQFFPDNGVTDVLEAVIAVVKQLAVGVLKGLDGLQSMLPGGAYLAKLDSEISEDTKYYALASDFEPEGGPIGIRALDAIVDRVFTGAHNDLVVPTDGVYQFGPNLGGFGKDAEARLHVFRGAGAPVHTRLFTEPITRSSLLAWLQ